MSKLASLKHSMDKHGVAFYLVPMGDAYGSEYVPECDRRIKWLTGFTGSNAFVIVGQQQSAFFTDGRYTEQAAKEVSRTEYSTFDLERKKPQDWLKQQVVKPAKVGYNPWLFTERTLKPFEALEEEGALKLRPLPDMITPLWTGRPDEPASELFQLSEHFAGKSAREKIKEVSTTLKAKGIEVFVLTHSESINWLLNIRGHDLPNTPLVRCHALLADNGQMNVFLDPARIDEEFTLDLPDTVRFLPPAQMELQFKKLKKVRVGYDPSQAPIAILDMLEKVKADLVSKKDPCSLPKAIKNEMELAGFQAAHIRDGVALCNAFDWIDRFAAGGKLTEVTISEKIEDFRAEQEHFDGSSFPAIVGFKGNGSIIHYKPEEDSCATIEGDGLLLIDSGGQYFDGTTDVTRTLAIGSPSAKQKAHYTRVLKGHIALARAAFPRGTTGSQLDVLARHYLWEVGLDYAHGTGHGVGHFLNVHEGPQRISKKGGDEPLRPGMVLSNEPGVYFEGRYGIRIENLVKVVERDMEGVTLFYGFETLTLVPFEKALIDTDMLTRAEKNWIEAYYTRIKKYILPQLEGDAKSWLQEQLALDLS